MAPDTDKQQSGLVGYTEVHLSCFARGRCRNIQKNRVEMGVKEVEIVVRCAEIDV